MMQGTRLPDNALHDDPFQPLAYGRVEVGGEQLRWQWWAVSPNGHLGNLDAHEVTEHEDGTITVSPSILISEPNGTELWHGYLEHGVWRSC